MRTSNTRLSNPASDQSDSLESPQFDDLHYMRATQKAKRAARRNRKSFDRKGR